jgi:aspartate aminotransferase-like enzyme
LTPWATEPADAAGVCTTVRLPAGRDAATVLGDARERFGVALLAGAGELVTQLIRIDHMGTGATPAAVVAALAALGGALGLEDTGAGVQAAVEVFQAAGVEVVA